MKCIYKKGETSIITQIVKGKCEWTGEDAETYAKRKGAKIMDIDKAVEEIEKIFIKPFEETTESEYDEMLNILPPEKWKSGEGVTIFRMSEYDAGNITRHYVKYKDRYFKASRRIDCSYRDIAQEVKNII